MRVPRIALGVVAVLSAGFALGAAFGAAPAQAQLVAPATYFGTGLAPGDEVEVRANGKSCGTTSATTAGEWVVVVPTNAPCAPSTGDAITFRVNGVAVEESATWEPGGAPDNLQTGLALTVSGSAPPKPPPTESLIAGVLPASGFGLVTFGGSLQQLRDALASSCASGAPIFATVGGRFVGYFPTAALDAPNAAFQALYSGGLPSGTPLLGGNCN